VAAIGRMLEPRGRWRAAGIAALAAIGLCVAIRPWTVGALVVVACIGSVGLFVLATMLVCRAVGQADVVIREHMARSAMMAPGSIPGAVSDDHLSPAVAAVRRRDLRRRSFAAPF
jgi:hypothetical protein